MCVHVPLESHVMCQNQLMWRSWYKWWL